MTRRFVFASLVLVLAACQPSTSTPSARSNSPPSTAASADAPSIVGEWVGVHDCGRIVTLLHDAGLDEFIAEQAFELVPGLNSPEDLEGRADPCEGAEQREHSHFFTADGSFGSRDDHGQQVDDGTYELVGDDAVVINGSSFHYRIDGDSLYLTPDPVDTSDCTSRMCRFEPVWVLTVAMPGMPWTRGTISVLSDPLAGAWNTGSLSFADIRLAMLDTGLTEADFRAWAEGQDLAQWPEDPQAPSEVAIGLEFLTDEGWQISVESAGQSIGVIDSGTYRLNGEELSLTSEADGDVGTFAAAVDGDRLTLTLHDTQEVGASDAAYIHHLYAVALFASAPFVRMAE